MGTIMSCHPTWVTGIGSGAASPTRTNFMERHLMRRVLVAAFLTAPVVVTPRLCASQVAETPGLRWQSIGAGASMIYVRGAIDGSILALNEILNLYRDPEFRRRLFATGPSAVPFDTMAVFVTEHLRGIHAGQMPLVVKLMDQFYTDTANGCIPWGRILEAAARKLRGASASATEESLTRERRQFAAGCGS